MLTQERGPVRLERRRSAARLAALQSPSLRETPAALPHVPGFPRLGVLRRLRPTRPVQRSMHLSRPVGWPPTAPGTVTGWFPCSLLFVRRRRSPTWSLRHRHGYAADLHHGLPDRRSCPTRKLPTDVHGRKAPPPALIHQVRAGNLLRDVMTPVPRVLLFVSLAGPAPSGSAGTSRLCQGCSHPLPAPPRNGLPSATSACCDRPTAAVFHLHSNNSASRRTGSEG
jgi:hypothetical protein